MTDLQTALSVMAFLTFAILGGIRGALVYVTDCNSFGMKFKCQHLCEEVLSSSLYYGGVSLPITLASIYVFNLS